MYTKKFFGFEKKQHFKKVMTKMETSLGSVTPE